MLSNHYPVTYANSAVIPVLVALIIVAGALIRHFFNVRHADHAKSPWWTWAVALVALWLAFWVAMASSPGGRERLGLSVVFITHDLRVAAQICDRIAVMHRGRVVEEGPAAEVLGTPRDAYTQSLLASVPGRGWTPPLALAEAAA